MSLVRQAHFLTREDLRGAGLAFAGCSLARFAFAGSADLPAFALSVSSALAALAGVFLPGGRFATLLVSFLATGVLGVRAGAAFLTGVALAGGATFLAAAFLAGGGALFLAGGADLLAGADRLAGADLRLVDLPLCWEAEERAFGAGLFCCLLE